MVHGLKDTCFGCNSSVKNDAEISETIMEINNLHRFPSLFGPFYPMSKNGHYHAFTGTSILHYTTVVWECNLFLKRPGLSGRIYLGLAGARPSREIGPCRAYRRGELLRDLDLVLSQDDAIEHQFGFAESFSGGEDKIVF